MIRRCLNEINPDPHASWATCQLGNRGVNVVRKMVLLCTVASALNTSLGNAQITRGQGMQFDLQTYDLRRFIGMSIQHIVGATGAIERGDGARLARFIEENALGPGTLFLLNSAGGNLEESLIMARILRAKQFSTSVGQFGPNQLTPGPPGECYSACTFMFLGGVYRSVPADAVYEVCIAGFTRVRNWLNAMRRRAKPKL